jgi:hypothetical protein
LSRRMWISLIRYWRSGSIWQKCERRGRARHFCCGLSGHQEQGRARARAARRSGRRRTAGCLGAAAGTCDRVVKVSFGRVECREFARTVGDNEVVGPIPLSLDWEVLSVMVASVDQYEDFGSGARAERRTFSYHF